MKICELKAENDPALADLIRVNLKKYRLDIPGTVYFDENLNHIANEYLEESVRKIESLSDALNTVGILLISGVIAWVVLGTFQMQDQITAFFS